MSTKMGLPWSLLIALLAIVLFPITGSAQEPTTLPKSPSQQTNDSETPNVDESARARFSPPAKQKQEEDSPMIVTVKQKSNGFMIQTSLGLVGFLARTPVDSPLRTNDSVLTQGSSWQGEVLLGYKWDRVIFGCGVDLISIISDSQSGVIYRFIPTLQVAMLRSPQKRIEMIGSLQIGLGGAGEKTMVVGYRAAAGLRGWILPQLALNLLGGIQGTHLVSVSTRSSDGYLGPFFTLGGLGVF